MKINLYDVYIYTPLNSPRVVVMTTDKEVGFVDPNTDLMIHYTYEDVRARLETKTVNGLPCLRRATADEAKQILSDMADDYEEKSRAILADCAEIKSVINELDQR